MLCYNYSPRNIIIQTYFATKHLNRRKNVKVSLSEPFRDKTSRRAPPCWNRIFRRYVLTQEFVPVISQILFQSERAIFREKYVQYRLILNGDIASEI